MAGEVPHKPEDSEMDLLAGPPGLGLGWWERLGLVALAAVMVVFGAVVEFRSAFLHRRMGDLNVFVRTAWAIRTGGDIYTITDDNGFHYLYPPLFAIVLTPLADPPVGADRSGMLPYPVIVGLWYVLNVICLGVAVNWLAGALEQTSSNPEVRSQPRGCRRWWLLRVLPILACLPAIGHTLMRGQVGLLLLLLLCGMVSAGLRGRRWQAGLWLAGAICLKIIPAFLLLYPLWRRDVRWLAGCGVGLVVGLAVIPAAVCGPARTVAYYREWTQVMLLPAMAEGEDRSRAKELLEMTATDSQSLLVAFHNTLYPDRATRPRQALPWVRGLSWLVGGLLTVGAMVAAGRRRGDDGPGAVVFVGVLVLLMLLLSPVCHLHYFCLSVPLIMGLLAANWEGQGDSRLGKGMIVLLMINVVANVIPHLPGMEVPRDLGLAMYAALLLWLVGCLVLWKGAGLRHVLPVERTEKPAAAA